MNKKRVAWVDVTRFLGMFAVYIGHLGSNAGLAYNFVFQYHVPLFFFISGCMSNYDDEDNFFAYVVKKIKTILLPFYIFALSSLFISTLINHLTVSDIIWELKLILKGCIRNTFFAYQLWFFTCLFVIEIVFKLIKYLKNKPLIFGICLIIAGLSPFYYHGPSLLYNIDSVFYIAYYATGFCLYPYLCDLFNFDSKNKKIITIVMLAISLCYSVCVFFGFNIIDSIYIPKSNVIGLLFTYFKTLIIISLNLIIARILQNIIIFSKIGRESLYVCGNEWIIKTIIPFLLGLIGISLNANNLLKSCIYVIALLLLNIYVLIPLEKGILKLMNKNKNKQKRHSWLVDIIVAEKKWLIILFALISVISLIFFLPSIMNGLPLTFGTDIKPQWFEFYTEFKNLMKSFIHEQELPFYSWSLFLGNNFYASKSYYLIGDPYNYLGLLLPGNFFDIARALTYLKFLVSGFSFYLFLSEFNRKPLSKLLVSLAYAFSGWAIFYSGQLVFLSFYSFVPLYLLGLERSLKRNKPVLFMVASALLFSVSWYFFYTLTLITPLYFLYRYALLELDKKKLLGSIFKHVGYYLLGIMITAVIWLPGIIYVTGTPRFSSYSPFDIFTYLHFLVSSFIPNYLYIYRNNIFETGQHYSREICIWASTSLIILLPQIKNIFDKKERILTLLGYLIFFVIGNIRFLDSMMHGFGDPSFRWVFLLVIFNLMNICRILDNIDKIDKKLLWESLVGMICLLGICFGISLIVRKEPISNYYPQLLLIIIYVIVASLTVIFIFKDKKMLFSILVVVELAASGLWCYGTDLIYNDKLTQDYAFMDSATSVLQDYPGGLNESLSYLDDNNMNEFYRIYVPYDSIYWSFSHNMSLHYGLKGLMTYDSTYSYSFAKMYELVPEVSSYNSGWIFDVDDENLMIFLNTKYAITTASDTMGDSWELINDDFHYGLYLYENKNYHDLGKTYSKIMTEEEYKKYDDTSLFNEYVITDENIEEIESYLSDVDTHLENIEASHNHLTASYYSDDDGFMIISIPYDKGWKILIDNQKIDYFEVNGGFIGFHIDGGQHDFAMYFVPQGFKVGLLMSVTGIIGVALFYIINKNKSY